MRKTSKVKEVRKVKNLDPRKGNRLLKDNRK